MIPFSMIPVKIEVPVPKTFDCICLFMFGLHLSFHHKKAIKVLQQFALGVVGHLSPTPKWGKSH